MDLQEQKDIYFNGRERMNPELENILKSNTTELAENPAFPKTDINGNPINFLELIAYKRFNDVVKNVKRYTNLENVTGQNGMGQLTSMLMQSFTSVVQMEKPHIEELENLAVDLVVKEMEIPDGAFQFNCKIVRQGEINQDGFQKETKNPQEDEVENQFGEQAQAENMTPSELFELEKQKRRFVNLLIQGSSKKGHYMFELVRDKINKINPQLSNNYGIMMSINDIIYWLLSDETIKSMASQPQNMGGKEEIEIESESESENETGLPTIKTEAVCFPIAVHEVIKGIMEVFGTKGLPDDPKSSEMIIDSVDSLSNETMDLRVGVVIWEKFREQLPQLVFEEGKKHLQHYIFSRFCGLETTEFFRVARMIMVNDPKGAKYLQRMTDEIISDLNVKQFEGNQNDINEDDINIDDIFNYKKGGQTKNKKGDIGKSGTQYGYTLKEWNKIAEKNGLLVSPTQWWKSQEGKKYKDFIGRNKIVGQHSGDKEQQMNRYGYMIANGMDLGSDKIPASAKKYVQDNNLNKFAGGGKVKAIKESDIQVGVKFNLMNGEIIEINRLFIENYDENWVEYSRDGEIYENSVNSLKNFINNWRADKKENGGMAGLSEVSGMLPNPLPMSTIQPMANGGKIYGKNIYNLILPIGFYVRINPSYTATIRNLNDFENYLKRKDEVFGKQFGEITNIDKSASKEWVDEFNYLIARKKAELKNEEIIKYEVGDSITIHRNQGDREAYVIAVIDNEILVEYSMPNGTSALNIIDTSLPEYDKNNYKKNYIPITYDNARISKKWSSKIDANGLINNPQGSKKRFADGGEIVWVDNFELDQDKINRAKYIINYNSRNYTIIDNKTKKAITSFPTQISAVNYINTELNKFADGGSVDDIKSDLNKYKNVDIRFKLIPNDGSEEDGDENDLSLNYVGEIYGGGLDLDEPFVELGFQVNDEEDEENKKHLKKDLLKYKNVDIRFKLIPNDGSEEDGDENDLSLNYIGEIYGGGLDLDEPFVELGFQVTDKFADGGKINSKNNYDVYDNKRMLLNQANEIEHHSEELNEQVKITKQVPAWVIAKMERATTDLSDITHYLDGENKMAYGGSVDTKRYDIVPSGDKFIVVQVYTRAGSYSAKSGVIIRDFNGNTLKFDDVNTAKNFINNIEPKYPYGIPKANAGLLLLASQLLKPQPQQQPQPQPQQQPQIVYYVPKPVEEPVEETINEISERNQYITQDVPLMAFGGDIDEDYIPHSDFCITNLLHLANDIQKIKYYVTHKFNKKDFEYENYKGRLIIIFDEPASINVVSSITKFIERAEDCHHIFEQSTNVSGSNPNQVSINLLIDKFTNIEFGLGGKVYEFAPKKINLKKTKNIKTNDGEFVLGLISEDFVYFINSDEGNENSNTIMYNKKGELLSDNYFASNDLFETLENQITFEFIHPDLKVFKENEKRKNKFKK